MGISIYYKGKFNPQQQLSELIAEVIDIATTNDWIYQVWNTEFNCDLLGLKMVTKDIYGISLTPKDCETMSFTFASNGRLISQVALFLEEGESLEEHAFGAFTKTQYAGIKTHLLLVDLFRYISEKYLLEAELLDDARYWETNDKEIAIQNFNKNSFFINSFSDALCNTNQQPGESLEDLLERVAKEIRRKSNK